MKEMISKGGKIPIDNLIELFLPEGWVLHAIDCSLSPRVTLIRNKKGCEWWHSLPESKQKQIDLYVSGIGNTVQEAIQDAGKIGREEYKNKCIHPDCECLDYCEALDPYSKTPIENPDTKAGA